MYVSHGVQIRVRNDSCTVHADFKTAIQQCFSPYSDDAVDKAPFGPMKGTAWTYSSQEDLGTSYYSGELAVYSGGGNYKAREYVNPCWGVAQICNYYISYRICTVILFYYTIIINTMFELIANEQVNKYNNDHFKLMCEITHDWNNNIVY